MNIPWTELLRPNKIDDILGKSIRDKLNILKSQKYLPNLILCGNSGLGKTSSVLALAKELIQDENLYNKQIIELNASDERGIDIVRNKIKMFSSKKVINENFSQKIIILDEADNLTNSAQQALRCLMTEYDKVVFILSCNNLNLIIEPIQSRCQIIKYTKIENEEIYNYIKKICNKFDLKINDKIIYNIIEQSNSDIRYIINTIQKIHYYNEINFNYEYMSFRDKDIKNLVNNLIKNNNLDNVLNDLEKILSRGLSVQDILNYFIEEITDTKLCYETKFKILELSSNFKINYTEGLNSNLQLYNFVVNIYCVINNNINNN
jgi:DNA polymerase III delta prime subunit